MQSDATIEGRFWSRVRELARLLVPGGAEGGDEGGTDPAIGAQLLCQLAAADPDHAPTWSAVASRRPGRALLPALVTLTDLHLQVLLGRVMARLARHGRSEAPVEAVRPEDRAQCLRIMADRFPSCAADSAKLSGLLRRGEIERAVRHLERMLAGIPARSDHFLWPPATHSSWYRILGDVNAPGAAAHFNTLVLAYWQPVREFFARNFRADADTAEAATNDFFGDVKIRNSLKCFDPRVGKRFRDYLAAALYNYFPRWRRVHGARPGLCPPEELADRPVAAPEPGGYLECALWRSCMASALAEAERRIRARHRAPLLWQVFEAWVFERDAAPPTQAELARRFGLTVYQVNNYLHQVRVVVGKCLPRVPGRTPGAAAAADPLAPPVACAPDVRFAFDLPVLESVAGRTAAVQVFVLDEAGAHNPLTFAPGVAIRKLAGVGEVLTPAPHRFSGVDLDGRYVRMGEAIVHSAAPGEMTLGLRDDLTTGLDVSDRMTVRFHRA